MWQISTQSFVMRDQFTVLPMPEEVIKILDAMAAEDGITRASNLFERGNPGDKGVSSDGVNNYGPHNSNRMPPLVEDDESDNEDVGATNGPTMKAIPPDRRSEEVDDVSIKDIDDNDDEDNPPRDYESELPIESDLRANEERTNRTVPEPQDDWVQRSVRIAQQIGLVIETGTVRNQRHAAS